MAAEVKKEIQLEIAHVLRKVATRRGSSPSQ